MLWGAYHALLFVPLLLLNKNRRYRDTVATITLPDGTTKTKLLPSFKETGQMLMTFALAVFGWIIFRAQDISQFGEVISTICSDSLLSVPNLINRQYYIPLAISILVLILVEWINRTKEHGFVLNIRYKWLRLIIYYSLIFAIVANFVQEQSFIYFQF